MKRRDFIKGALGTLAAGIALPAKAKLPAAIEAPSVRENWPHSHLIPCKLPNNSFVNVGGYWSDIPIRREGSWKDVIQLKQVDNPCKRQFKLPDSDECIPLNEWIPAWQLLRLDTKEQTQLNSV